MQRMEFIEIDDAMRMTLQDLRPADFSARLRENPSHPRLWVLRVSDWEQLSADCAWVEDRGFKHKAKGLQAYLAEREHAAVVRADYDSAGRCLQSIEALLRSATDSLGWRLFLLAVDASLFDELMSCAADAGLRARSPNATPDLNALILDHLGRVPADHPSRRKLIGSSEKIELARSMAERASHCVLPVLILGDSGTGKEVTARLVHTCGERAQTGRFLAVNCAAIPDDLLESELFGSVKGAYTGAIDKKGLWEMAQDGTLFLDEIGDLSLRHQAKVLRVLEEGVLRRVGADGDIRVNARVIAATHRDIEGRVRAESFRQDLYYRLYGIRILLPSLDECPEDIPGLALHFWRGILGNPSAQLSSSVRTMLESMAWPGNGRQLKALLQRVHQLFDTDAPSVEQLRLLSLHEAVPARMNAARRASSDARPRVDALAQLRRAAAALHAVELLLKDLRRHSARRGASVSPGDLKRSSLRAATHELRALTHDPLLFGSLDLFRQMEQVVEQLAELEGLADGESEMAEDDAAMQALQRVSEALSSVFLMAERISLDISQDKGA